MKGCDNELKIFDYLENEVSQKERDYLNEHLQYCLHCRKLFDEYSAIKKKTNIFYSSIDLSKTQTKRNKINGYGKFFKKASIGFSIAASFVIGFLLISNNLKPDFDYSGKTDSIYQAVDEPIHAIKQSEWNLELNLIRYKIELIHNQMKH